MELVYVLLIIVPVSLILIGVSYTLFSGGYSPAKRFYYWVIRGLTKIFSDPKRVSILRRFREAQYRRGNRATICYTPFFSNMYPGAEDRLDASREECSRLRAECEKAGALLIQIRAFGFVYFGKAGSFTFFRLF